MTAADDATVLTLLRALNPSLRVHDGDVPDANPSTRVISAALPYVVFYAMTDAPAVGDSLAGTSGAYLTGFYLNFVGDSREQAKLAGERARAALDRQWVTLPRGPRFVRVEDNSVPPSRDDTWTRPGGAPLFQGRDQYVIGV